MGKPSGLKTARKLRVHRRDQRWHDLGYKKAHLGTRWKANPFGGSSHAKGIVLEKVGVEAKQPNSAIRKCVRVQLIKNGKKITAFVPNDGCLNYIEENDEVLISGFGGPVTPWGIFLESDSRLSKLPVYPYSLFINRRKKGPELSFIVDLNDFYLFMCICCFY
jgi:small subunit ribosomal protein S23e